MPLRPDKYNEPVINLTSLFVARFLIHVISAMGDMLCGFVLIAVLFIQFWINSSAGDTLRLGTSLRGNQTIISENGTFELGFFSPNGSNWYIGIWYGQIPEKTYVWVANRETPVRTQSGVLTLSKQGNLVLRDADGASIWTVNKTTKASRAVLLNSGNFLLLAEDKNILWQSFDNPADTLLPGMMFSGQQRLVSWKSSTDPSPGLFSLQNDRPFGATQFVLKWNNSVPYWSTGIWDGKMFSQIPEITDKHMFNFSVQINGSGLYFNYELVPNFNALVRLVVTTSGQGQQFVFIDNDKWSMIWSVPRDGCEVYAPCGAFATCDSRYLPLCSCLEGFEPVDNHAWLSQDWASTGCVRQSLLNCSTDNFINVGVLLQPTDQSISYPASTKEDCKNACLRNCSCTAFAFNRPSGPCQIWSGDLLNIHNSTPSIGDSKVFLRVGSSQLSKKRKATCAVCVVVAVVVALTVALAIISSVLIWWRRQRQQMDRRTVSSDSFLRMFTYKELKIATRNFRYELGTGGFGSVFRGSLPDGTLVAVKKMKGSRQDEKQFRAEISSLGNIQHVNLVRLRGFCAERSRRLLIYDYMPNGSLNSLLFTKSKEKVLDWKARLQIALGTGRGLLYLHEECRGCIIHSDVKPENILLDGDLSPKLADFGFAKMMGKDLSRVLTTTRGTRGYLAPEWISGVPITPKVDVYSFGMTLLEIISGRRNLDLNVDDPQKLYFPTWAATQVQLGNTFSIVEESVAEEADMEEVKRACIVALLCIQEDEEVRPTMKQVVQMLEGKMEPQMPHVLNPVLMERPANERYTGSLSDGTFTS